MFQFQIISSPAHTGSVTPTMQPSPAMGQGPPVVGGQSSGTYTGMAMGQHGMMGPN